MEDIRIRTPHTKILKDITLSSSSSTALLLCHRLFLLPFEVSVSFRSHLHGGEKLTSSCHSVLYTYPSIYSKKKTVGILINYRLGCNKAICFFTYTTIRLGLKLSLFQQFLIKVKHQQIKWYQRLGIQYYKIKNMLGNVNRL